jgi:glycosyltransferase involved in cell wall biosynthesis
MTEPGAAEPMTPRVDVVIATHNRPELLRVALDAVLGQTYAGEVRVTLVFD